MNSEEFIEKFQQLTPKPRKVLVLLASGVDDEAIASSISASTATVRKHIQNLCDRFEIEPEVKGFKRNRREDLLVLLTKHLAQAADAVVAASDFKPVIAASANLTTPHHKVNLIGSKQASGSQNQDWGEAIDVSNFLGREDELTKLEQWIVSDSCRLVAVLGMGGIGKTTLAMKLAQRIQYRFRYIIWRSIRSGPPLNDVLAELIQFLSEQQETHLPESEDERISLVISYLQKHQCLLVLDNVESILKNGDSAGQYRDGYEKYGDFFHWIGEATHQSCLILTSREKPKQVAPLEGENLAVRALSLVGLQNLEGQQLFHAKGAFSGKEADWSALISLYAGNPLALKIVATSIQELFAGNISEFLEQAKALSFGDIRDLLAQQFNRISNLEKEVMYWLAIEREAVSVAELREDIISSLSRLKLLDALESLGRRSLIERNPDRAIFTLQPVVMEYVSEQFVEQICQEIESQKIKLFNQHALIKAEAKDYIRETQIRQILKPVIERLLEVFEDAKTIQAQLLNLLAQLKEKVPAKPGYTGGNSLNLLCHLGIDLSGADFSDLTIWQAYLQGMNLHRVNFTNSNLSKTVFTETLGSILALSFNPDSRLLAIGDANGEIRLWQVADGKQLRTLRRHSGWVRAVSFSPDGQTLASGSSDQSVRLWNVNTGDCLKTIVGHTGWVRAVAFSPDGQTLASGSADQTLRLWDVRTGVCLNVLSGHTSWVRSVAFSYDGKMLASGSDDQTIRLWDAQTGECRKTLWGHEDRVRSIAFSPTQDWLVSGSSDRTVRLWDTQTGQCLRVFQGHTNWVWSTAFSADGRTIASGSDDQTIRLWDAETGQRLRTLRGHTNWVLSVALSPDGAMIASGSGDQTVRLWDVQSGKCLRTLRGNTNWFWSLAFSSDGRILASGSGDHTVKLWDAETGSVLNTLHGHTRWVWAVAFSPDGQTIASSSEDRTIRLWDVMTGRCLNILKGHTNGVWSVAFSPNGNMIASASDDQAIRLWTAKTGECLTTLQGHTNSVRSIAFSPDGQYLASGGDDQFIRIWNVKTGQCLNMLSGHARAVHSVAFSPDGQLLASCSEDKTIKLWQFATGQCLKTLDGHTERVWSIAFAADGQTLASASDDHSVRLWNVFTGECLTVLHGHTHWVWSVAFSRDGQTLASSSQDETIRIWDVKTAKSVRTLRAARPYEDMNIKGATGLTEMQRKMLMALGAVETDINL